MTDVDLHATQHTEVAAFKSLLPVLQQGIALVGEYSELRAHLEGQRLGWLDILKNGKAQVFELDFIELLELVNTAEGIGCIYVGLAE